MYWDTTHASFLFLYKFAMGDNQPVEPEVQLLGDPVVPVVNPAFGQNENENVARPQELERGWENVERIWNGPQSVIETFKGALINSAWLVRELAVGLWFN